MKKSFHPQWYILILTVAAAIIGAVIRFRQLQFELLPDGSLAEGSYLHIPLIILSVVLIGGLIGLLLPLSERKSPSAILLCILDCHRIYFIAASSGFSASSPRMQ